MKIKDVADRSGFTPATLRYYEDLGLLPEPARTPAGYRSYDESTVDRLAFIARAKQLGCSLDEIADLTTAWAGGRCGPLQDQLRSVVADKLADARAQIAELTTLVHDLRSAAVALELHRPDGACDDQCGCVSEPTAAITLGTRPTRVRSVASEPPIACTLRPDALRGQLDDWRALLAHAESRTPLADGVRLQFDAAIATAELMRLAAAEQSCCQFLRFAITVDTRGIALEVRGPADAQPIIDTLFGAPT